MSLEKDLVSLIQDNFDIDDVWSDDQIIDFIKKNYEPEDVFDTRNLESWAEDHDFIRFSALEKIGYIHSDELAAKGFIHIDEINKIMFESK